MRTASRLATSVASALVFVLPLSAQAAHPDFSGTWVLDASKTTVDGQMPAPTSGTYVIAMHGDSISTEQHSVSDMGANDSKRLMAVDGYEWKNSMTYQGTVMPLTSTLGWKDRVLTIHTTADFQGYPVDQAETWTLGPDGKTLVIAIETGANGQSFGGVTMVFNKK